MLSFRTMHPDGYLLGIDIGSSSVKSCLMEVRSGKTIASAQSPATQMPMLCLHPGWAEQDPEMWWQNVIISVRVCLEKSTIPSHSILAIGITYQMHGLVVVDKSHQSLRPAIIWCDSRAVEIGGKALKRLGETFCLEHFLNFPGNFTASKLRWVKENEHELYGRIHKVMLPGDFIALKMTGESLTTEAGLSEGILWDFQKNSLATDLLREFEIDDRLLPAVVKVFSVQGKLTQPAAEKLGLKPGTRISYRAGDQPNNALSVNVLEPGETAATAGTSGVIYSVTEKPIYDYYSRVNTFIHVNNETEKKRNGVLLCVNGAGILNSWLRNNVMGMAGTLAYDHMNVLATKVPVGAEGISLLPFGNGAERILGNRSPGSIIHGLEYNRHTQAHLFRAAQEGIVFAMMYGFEILKEIGVNSRVIKSGHSNMFLSPLFREAFANTTRLPLELYDTDGAKGAARGAGIGAGIYGSFGEAFHGLQLIELIRPDPSLEEQYMNSYQRWKKVLTNCV